jgi:hypothetical protein
MRPTCRVRAGTVSGRVWGTWRWWWVHASAATRPRVGTTQGCAGGAWGGASRWVACRKAEAEALADPSLLRCGEEGVIARDLREGRGVSD